MTRLIKAEALAEALEKHEKNERNLSDYQHGINDGLQIAEMELEDAPTIDAVPVEFIDAQLAEYKGAMSLDKSEREFVFAATAAGTLQRLKHKWAEREEE